MLTIFVVLHTGVVHELHGAAAYARLLLANFANIQVVLMQQADRLVS